MNKVSKSDDRVITVINKADLLQQSIPSKHFYINEVKTVPISVRTQYNIDTLLSEIESHLSSISHVGLITSQRQ